MPRAVAAVELANWVHDLERLGAQVLAIHGRELDPGSLPDHQYELRRKPAGFQLEAILRDIAGLDRLATKTTPQW